MTNQKAIDSVARIIEPDAMRVYEAGLSGSPTWDQVINFSTVKVARQKAEAIIALLLPKPVCTEDDGSNEPVYASQLAGNYSDQDDPKANPYPV